MWITAPTQLRKLIDFVYHKGSDCLINTELFRSECFYD